MHCFAVSNPPTHYNPPGALLRLVWSVERAPLFLKSAPNFSWLQSRHLNQLKAYHQSLMYPPFKLWRELTTSRKVSRKVSIVHFARCIALVKKLLYKTRETHHSSQSPKIKNSCRNLCGIFVVCRSSNSSKSKR